MKTNSLSAGLAVHARTISTTRQLSFRRAWVWTGFLAFATIAFGPQPAQAAVTEAWVQRYGSEAASADYAHKVVTDAAGNVIVAGSTAFQTGVIIKYSGVGVPLWTNCYDSASHPFAPGVEALAVDGSGNVFVMGSSATIAYSGAGAPLWTNGGSGTAIVVDGSGNVLVTGSSTIAYSGAGVPLWTNHYFGSASAVAVDASGNVFVTGSSYGSGGDPDYATIAYSGAGVPLWTNRYNGTGNYHDFANAVAVDGSGNVFVTGYSAGSGGDPDYATIAYSGAGVPLWTNRYNGPANGHEQARAVAVDGSGNVFVTGYSVGSGSNEDYATIAYSGAGVPLWTNRYNGTANGSDEARAVAVDGSGNVFVTGFAAGSGGRADYATIAYSGAGVPLWTNRYNGTANGSDGARAVAVDGSGNVFVTGYSTGSGGGDYATIAYSGAGVALWTNRYGGRGNASDIATAVAVDGSSNVFVTGYSGSILGHDDDDYATIAYSGAGVPLWTNRYNGPANGDDQSTAVAVDGSGNVFVTGVTGWSSVSGGYSDYATIAYSAAGVPLWTNRYGGQGNALDIAFAVAVDGSGNVFVTGYSGSILGDNDYATIAYSGAGVPLWTNRYNGPANRHDVANAVAVDGSGNVFVTGGSFDSGGYYDYATIAYSGAGVPLWTNRYNGPANRHDVANAVAVDGSGNVFVTGSSYVSGGYSDHATIAYSGAGVPLWTNRYRLDAVAVAVDGNGNVFVTGYSYGNGGRADYATIAYSGAGVPLWTNRYNGPENGWDQANAVAVDGSGNVFVTGSAADSGGWATIAYSGAGVPLWTNRYDGAPSAVAVAVDASGNVFVTGYSVGSLGDSDFVTVKYVWRTEIAIQLLSTIPPKVNLTLSGAPNSSWAIERALDPTGPWTNLSALRIGTNGSAQFQDTNSLSPAGFYRARQ